MKKLITLLAAMVIAGSVSAQSQTAYLDLYQRGNGQHLRTTLIFNQEPIYLGKKNLGEVLNMLAELGWKVDKTFAVRRIGIPITRHKFHIILKKEYQVGENPFEGLTLTYNLYSFSANDEDSLAIQQKNVLLFKKAILDNAFQNNHELTEFSIPEAVTIIGSSAFYNCENLRSIIIPQKITHIGKFAFGECYKLKNIYCRALTPPSLEPNAFLHLSHSAQIYVPKTSVELYKKTKGWEKYAKQIVGYDF